jgi:methylmalonyl-CoA mutase
VVAALEGGLIAGWVAENRAELSQRIAQRELKVLGVTDFPSEALRAAETAPEATTSIGAPSPRLPGPDGHCPPLVPVRLEDLA